MSESGVSSDAESTEGGPQRRVSGPFAATLENLSHELKSPLNAILGYASLLTNEPSLSEVGRRRLEAIERSGEHMLELINAFLQASAFQAEGVQLNLSPSSTVQLVEDVVSMFEGPARAAGIELGYRIASDTPTQILADIGKTRQILINLVGNAVKYTKDGFVRVLVRASDLRGDTCTLHFEVMDSGRGIARHEQEQLFQRYARGANREDIEGVGLGLSISRHHARLLGGALSLDSRVGRGSVFRLQIPVTWLHYGDQETLLSQGVQRTLRKPPSHRSGTFAVSDEGEIHLPQPLAEELLTAARAGDASELLNLADEIEEHETATRVRRFVQSYDYASLIERVRGVPSAAGNGS